MLVRLRNDRAGNTLAMMAIALIPLLGFVGSAVDTARLYLIKVRMQQACDAGALAGRKFMASSASTTLDQAATDQANAFFRNNFKTGTYGVNVVNFTPTKTADNQVSGSATATVPMTLTSMLGFNNTQITVTCEARYDVADLDVMFVLDTTGSMAYTASDTNMSGQSINSYTRSDGTTGYYTQEKSNARIKALRAAVLNFYDTLTSSADPTTNIRYGFVPYSSTVNVGKIIPSNYLVSGTYTYSTRVPYEQNSGSPSATTYNNTNQATCNGYAGKTGYSSSGQATVKTVSWSSSNNKCTVTSQTVQLYYKFGYLPVDISQYVLGGWVNDPTKVNGSQSKWQGCVEERDTQALTAFTQTALPYDLDPDLAATSDSTKWRPMWPDVVYERYNYYGPTNTTNVISSSADGSSRYENYGDSAKLSSGYVSCGKQAQRLATMTRQQVSDFLNDPDFRPLGGTYHDTGMIWGTRLINPNGPFKADTAAWPGRNPPIRHIVFMTDGQMAPNIDIYGMYGLEHYDWRVTGNDYNSITDRHNARFLAECEAAKRRGITVWVIAFGDAMTAEEQQCASSSGNAFSASSDTQLNSAFQTIASRVAMLRISK
ncbi:MULTISPECIES: TadE/TadG family type IV pilus assembly protein [unclassified Sphingomonas]|uniref:TadE/TadG family type IV pilus assembly protein n=8 Tax=Pseudomonadota TaxID=1224 RepID=UPI0020168BFC|nr:MULTISPECIES: TadE/TadG family type IV pilus assembly protein [unclassified Sphingomonas]